MTKFRCPRCGHEEEAIAVEMVHACPEPHVPYTLRGLRLVCEDREVGVIMLPVGMAA